MVCKWWARAPPFAWLNLQSQSIHFRGAACQINSWVVHVMTHEHELSIACLAGSLAVDDYPIKLYWKFGTHTCCIPLKCDEYMGCRMRAMSLSS